ncbi:LOW QUALITY PROTEIN: ATP-dependent DNA helicase Q-like SIM [Nematostella vectensis]|uniref:LOW QUALITY PROTEIN: ATP-dependent DNA helicase Q-like SIM n=1 Tax=Nematostella vectensis TaxID=45351 RepID=UPI0013901DC3|nr:LOW QUALITY PROTEIN: ATP-dependent DNA helicase Q-like SIM [Nematostella vectensis]
MHDQVAYLNNNCVPAIAIGDVEEPDIIQQVQNGTYVVVYGSPWYLLSTTTWRGLFDVPSFKKMLIGVAIDEAHCIVQWGLQGAKKVPFRKWHGCLGELNSMFPETPMIILTATATKSTREQILDSLHLSLNDSIIKQSPDRANLTYVSSYLDKNEPLQHQFGGLIKEIQKMGKDTPRTIIYCQTRKQCSILFRMFEIYLREKMFRDGSRLPRDRLVEVFHAETPQSVKTHIGENMAEENGHLRVLISTIAFDMGVNCKQVRRIIHFGPSKSEELCVQECGRAGRDGLPSVCFLMYNGLFPYTVM